MAQGVESFNGIDLSAARQKLPQGKFQIDDNGDRFLNGAWQPRRGHVHASVQQVPAAITSLMGFDLPGTDFALIFHEGANLHGHLNVTEQ